VPQIEVTFDIDANGILNVSAKDLGTGKSQKIVITASSGLSKDEVEKMRKDAEAHADEDKARREEVELRNEADNVAYRAEKFAKSNGDKLGAAKSGIEDGAKAIRESLKGSDTAAIRNAIDKLNETMQAASGDLYKNAQANAEQSKSAGAAGPEPKAEGKKGDGPIIDAEVVDEKKS
jgi:molecular chaperone DnaK